LAIKYLDAKRIRGSSTAEGDIDGTGLKAYYKFNGSSSTVTNIASTITGNSTLGTDADLTLIGDPTYGNTGSPTNLGNSVFFDGTGDAAKSVTGSNTTSQWNFMHTANCKFTIFCWLKFPNTIPVNKWILSNSGGTDANVGVDIRTKSTGFRFSIMRGVGNNQVIDSDGSPALPINTDNGWHLYVFTYDQT